MLRELHISGLGVIDDLDLELHPGLNVLTGETGTGKTMVTVGLALALGRRASATLVRRGAAAARVQARFDAPPGDLGRDWGEDGELVLARSVSADGRSTARIGGQLSPLSVLAELAPALVEVHGQHEGVALLSPTVQTAFLDRFAGGAHLHAIGKLAVEHERLRTARAKLSDVERREREREREADLLAYQVREIEAVAPRSGETAALTLEEGRLAHAERLLERATSAERALGAEDGALDRIAEAAADLRVAAELDPGALALAQGLSSVATDAAELVRDLRDYRDGLELDPARLEEVRGRLAALRSLSRKYGETEDDVLAFLASALEQTQVLAGAGEARARLQADVEEAAKRVATLAAGVTEGRVAAAPRLAVAVEAELRELGMPDATVEVALVPTSEPTMHGVERVEFGFAPSPGQACLPLAKVASGGELSRTMLACRSVLADLDLVQTLVFDEVDAGIGGLAGVAVGRRLAALAADRQVLVVTHLPQIASFADRHLRVEKRAGTASVTVLDDAGRVQELTRMLAGLPRSEAAATHAEELLAEAVRVKAAR